MDVLWTSLDKHVQEWNRLLRRGTATGEWKKKGKHQKKCGRALLALTECHKVSVHMDREQRSHISNTYSNMHKQK